MSVEAAAQSVPTHRVSRSARFAALSGTDLLSPWFKPPAVTGPAGLVTAWKFSSSLTQELLCDVSRSSRALASTPLVRLAQELHDPAPDIGQGPVSSPRTSNAAWGLVGATVHRFTSLFQVEAPVVPASGHSMDSATKYSRAPGPVIRTHHDRLLVARSRPGWQPLPNWSTSLLEERSQVFIGFGSSGGP